MHYNESVSLCKQNGGEMENILGKFGLQTCKHNNLNIIDELKLNAILGFGWFEILFDGLTYEDFSSDKIDEIKQICEAFQINISIHAPLKEILFIREWDPLFSLCESLECKIISVHLSHLKNTKFPLKKLFHKAQEKGILLGIENHENSLGNFELPGEIHDFFRKNRYPENVGITLDTGHAILSGMRLPEFYQRIQGGMCALRVHHFHLHSNNGLTDEHLEFYKGNQQPLEFIKEIIRQDFPGGFILEYWREPEKDAELIESLFS